MKILIVHNPVAGGGRRKFIQAVQTELTKRGAQVTIYRTTGPGDATDYLLKLTDHYDCIAAAGGDGTTMEVLNGMVNLPDVPLGVIPLGTANVLPIELGLPKKPAALAETIVSGQRKSVHLARLNGNRFILMVGIGFDAWVVNRVNLKLKKKIGKGAYALAMLKQMTRYGRTRYEIVVDGETYHGASAIVTNARHYAGRFTLSKHADLSTPSLQVIIFRSPSRIALIYALLNLPFGRIERLRGIDSVTGRSIDVRTDAPDVLQADGDQAGELPALIEVEQTPVTVMVPR